MAQFVRFTNLSPDELVALKKGEVEEKVQAFCDLAKAPRTANRKMEELKTFFKCNGFRIGDRCNLVLERRYVGARQRSRPEYIPTDEEIARISRVVIHPKFRGIGLGAFLVRETLSKVDAKVIEVFEEIQYEEKEKLIEAMTRLLTANAYSKT